MSQLEQILPSEQAVQFSKYLDGLTPNTAHNITAQKVSTSLKISSKEAFSILLKCFNAGVLTIDYGIRCPHCDTLVKRISSQEDIPEDASECYSCGEAFNIASENIEVLYSINIPDFFGKGQQDGIINYTGPVAPENSLKELIASGYNLNKLLFNPTDEQYDELQKMYNAIFKQHETTKESGDTLENLTLYLFRLVRSFRVNTIKTKTNQIDCYVRNQFQLASGFLSFLGERIIIEAKNENKKPSGTYMHKLFGIISQCNSIKKLVTFGIIISQKSPPKTYLQIAHDCYLREGITLIHISGDELKDIITQKSNLLEVLERKRDEIATNATTDLMQAGIFTA